jgi:hypothetical protein
LRAASRTRTGITQRCDELRRNGLELRAPSVFGVNRLLHADYRYKHRCRKEYAAHQGMRSLLSLQHGISR